MYLFGRIYLDLKKLDRHLSVSALETRQRGDFVILRSDSTITRRP